MIHSQASDYLVVFLFIATALGFLAGGLLVASIVRPKRPNQEKNTTYECGEDAVGGTYGFFNFRFYAVALVFLLFEAEALFLFPWATVAGDAALIRESQGYWGWTSVFEIFLFIFVLFAGLVYSWRKGLLEWDKPKAEPKPEQTPVSESEYLALNDQY